MTQNHEDSVVAPPRRRKVEAPLAARLPKRLIFRRRGAAATKNLMTQNHD